MDLAQRLLSMLLTVWLAVTLVFFMLRILPGDAVGAQLAQSGASRNDIEQMRAQLGLDDSIFTQYARFMTDLAQGDLGDSLANRYPVNQLIAERFRPTALLAATTIVVAVIGGITLGIAGAFDSFLSMIARLVITLSISTPIYWTGTLAIALFSAELRWLPSSGTGRWENLVLPVGVLAFHTMGGIARVTQANIADIRQAPFVWVARSKGLSERQIVWRHILQVGLLPVVTVIALQMGFLLSGAVITESLFVRPGIGRLLLDSAIRQDYAVVQGIVVLAALVYITLNTLAEGIYRLIDPRIAV